MTSSTLFMGHRSPATEGVSCPHLPVVAPAWLWRKIASRGVSMQHLRAADLMKHLSHDELAEWNLVPHVVASALGISPVFLTDIVERNDPSDVQALASVLVDRSSNDALTRSLNRKLSDPQYGPGNYHIELTPGYMWVLVDKGFLYNVALDPAYKTSVLEDVLSRHMAMMPVEDISKLSYFKVYVSGISTGT